MIQYIFKQNNTMHVWLPCKHQLSIISLSVTKTNAVKAASFYIFPLQFQRWHRNPIITTHSIYSGHTSRSRVAITGTPTAEKSSGVQHHYMLTSHQHYSATIARQTQKTYSAMKAKQSHCDFTTAQNWSPSFGSDVCPDGFMFPECCNWARI